ncbi:unnamed protein product, partial [Ectocarpus sp. 8 AP-2014]
VAVADRPHATETSLVSNSVHQEAAIKTEAGVLATRLFIVPESTPHGGTAETAPSPRPPRRNQTNQKQLNDGLSQRQTTVLCSRFPTIRRDYSQGATSITHF